MEACGGAQVNERVAGLDTEIRTNARHDADMRRLMEIPGVGPTIATALVAAIGDGSSFHRARTVLHLVRDRSTPLARWVDALKARAHANVAGVAMANKLARKL
ncbi:transposase [Aquicoccus sp. SU-CL01552]|uniref:transposase n=1 Tax=Aquicoccus sp. SU-CL01552 TaxID=3127656 RepID=UPI0033423315